MILLLVSIVLSLFGFQAFIFIQRITTINRAVVYTPKQLAECSIPFVNGANEVDIYFDKTTFENYVLDYYETSVAPFMEEYTVDFYYYNLADHSYCTDNKCQGVEITVKGTVFLSFKYSRTIFYEIHRNN